MLFALSAQAKNTIDIRGTVYSLDTIFHAKVGPGTTQTHLELVSPSNSRLQVFYLTVDKSTPGVTMRAVCATDKVAGIERPSAMAKRKSVNGRLYFAGTNGDFYTTSGTATNGSSKVGSPTTGCTADRETYKTSNGNYQFSVDTAGIARVSRLYYYTGTATIGEKVTLFKGINVASPNNGITIYTPKYWGSTNQSARAEAGCAEVTAKLVEGDAMYAGCKFRLEVTSTATHDGDTAIPSNGYVIHGRGTSLTNCNTGALDFVNALQVGDIVEFDNIVLVDQNSTERIVPAQIVSGNPKNVGLGETLDTESERADAVQLHPRTGLGVSQSGDSIIMMVIDGRSSISAGVRTSMLADVMRYAGAYEGLNVDGGGSSTLYTAALGVRNNCSDGSERAVGNGIFATIDAPTDNEIAEIRFKDWVKGMPKYSYYTPTIYGYNKYGVLVNTNLQGVSLSCATELGVISEDGSTLYANGAGTHALTATYNGITASIAVTTDDEVSPQFKAYKIISDSYNDYKVETFAVVNDDEMSIENAELTWTSDDTSVATVDENGVIKGLKNGTTVVRGELGNFKGEIEVTVEIPEGHYQAIDPNVDASTWNITYANVENVALSPLGTEGMAVDFTTTASRRISVTLEKDVRTWSRPDSLCIDINPGDCDMKMMYLYAKNPLNPEEEIEVEIRPTFATNQVNRLLVPMSDFVDVKDMNTIPLTLSKIVFNPAIASGVAVKLLLPRVAWVYNVVEDDNSGVEALPIDAEDLLLTPNPVIAGNVVKLNVQQAVKYVINSLSGAEVAAGENTEIPTAGLSAGVYIVSVKDNSKNKTARLMVK